MPKNHRETIDRFLGKLFLFMAVAFLVHAVLFANSLRAVDEVVWRSKIVWAAGALAIFLLVARKFSTAVKFRIFLVLLCFVLLELSLQAMAWLGVLPGLETKLKAPYARIYWSSEGHGNDIRNRFGWHFPAFQTKASRRIAVLGDSFVEAVEVNRTKNEAAQLQSLLQRQDPDRAVFALGNHGSSPAHHLDVLDYAQRHFQPQEVIVILYLGNDINESSPVLDYMPPGKYIYYDLDPGGNLVLNPESVGERDRFIRGMEFSHLSFLTTLPVTLNSHCMILQLADSWRQAAKRRLYISNISASDPEAAKYGRPGLTLKPFATTPDPEAQHAMAVMLAELSLMKQKCDKDHIVLRLVTVPFFPPPFYSTQHGTDWSPRFDEYDFFAPDRSIKAFAAERGIPFLSFGDWLMEKKVTAEKIQTLYFVNGSGHFTEEGHALCAQAMYEAFYEKQDRLPATGVAR